MKVLFWVTLQHGKDFWRVCSNRYDGPARTEFPFEHVCYYFRRDKL